MLTQGRFFWLTPLEWALLIVSATLCGCLTVLLGGSF